MADRLRDLGFLPVMPLAFTQAKCQVVVSSRALNEEAKELKWGSKETFGRTSLMARVMTSGAWPISLQSAGDVLFTVQDVLLNYIYMYHQTISCIRYRSATYHMRILYGLHEQF